MGAVQGSIQLQLRPDKRLRFGARLEDIEDFHLGQAALHVDVAQLAEVLQRLHMHRVGDDVRAVEHGVGKLQAAGMRPGVQVHGPSGVQRAAHQGEHKQLVDGEGRVRVARLECADRRAVALHRAKHHGQVQGRRQGRRDQQLLAGVHRVEIEGRRDAFLPLQRAPVKDERLREGVAVDAELRKVVVGDEEAELERAAVVQKNGLAEGREVEREWLAGRGRRQVVCGGDTPPRVIDEEQTVLLCACRIGVVVCKLGCVVVHVLRGRRLAFLPAAVDRSQLRLELGAQPRQLDNVHRQHRLRANGGGCCCCCACFCGRYAVVVACRVWRGVGGPHSGPHQHVGGVLDGLQQLRQAGHPRRVVHVDEAQGLAADPLQVVVVQPARATTVASPATAEHIVGAEAARGK